MYLIPIKIQFINSFLSELYQIMENFAGSKGVSMEYQVFLANVKERLKEELHGQVRVEDYRTLKNNGEERQGFVFQTEKEGISPVIYMEE